MSMDLATSKKLQHFGQALVAFRDDTGTLQVKDGYRPHLGAHLGAGGKVEGTAHPLPVSPPRRLRKTVAASRSPTPTVREQDGLIYLWHHPSTPNRSSTR